MSDRWLPEQAGGQHGRLAIVTGANTGLGYETALALAGLGVHTILACRSQEKAEAARQRILTYHPGAEVEVRLIDTGRMASVRRFAEDFQRDHGRLDLLINNAGIMVTPHTVTEDGFEGQLAVNYLGHFLLTGLLLPVMAATPGARVVSLYSLAHRWGGIQFEDFLFAKKYDAGKAYYQSKMACLMFALELDRRLKAAGCGVVSLAAHPGVSQSDLGRYLPAPLRWVMALVGPLLLQPADRGALPTLYAALGSDLRGGETIGPSGRGQRRGPPAQVDVEPDAHDQSQRDRLWAMTEELLGFSFVI